LKLAIEKNVDLRKLILSHKNQSRLLIDIAKKYDKPKYSIGDALNWLAIRRPDLYEAVTENKKGIEWFMKNFNNLRIFIKDVV